MMTTNIGHESQKLHRTYKTDLVHLLAGICEVPSVLNTVIHGVQMDSRKVKKGDLFLALSGDHSTSTDHICEAIERGANAVVAEGKCFKGKVFEDGDAVELFVDDLKQKVGEIADNFFQSPSKDLGVIGVTGTNGKTSVTSYLAKYFTLNGIKSGFIGTLGYGLADEKIYSTDHTTPSVIDVHRYLAELRDLEVKVVAMEVSSHGLIQGRTANVHFLGAVYTNLSREHLDYHETMDNYADAKSKLFKSHDLQFAVINADDSYADLMCAGLTDGVKLIRYSVDPASVDDLESGLNITVASSEYKTGICADINTPFGKTSIKSPLIGRFNLSNLLAVVGVAVALNHKVERLSAINEIGPVIGRMEAVKVSGQPTIVIDYAHTPDALKNALEALKPDCSGSLYLIFGCGGDRDIGKRKEMAAIAELLADRIIVTDDNPRTESPEKITNDILKGFNEPLKVEVVHDRSKAILKAITIANKSDVILIAGKGHETWQEVKGERTFFSDVEEVNKHIASFVKLADQVEGEQQ